MLKPCLLYLSIDFVQTSRIGGLDQDGILSTNEMYKFLVRIVKKIFVS